MSAPRDAELALGSLLAAERREAQRRHAELMRRCLAAEAEVVRLRQQLHATCVDGCPLHADQRTEQQCARCADTAQALKQHTDALAQRLGYRPAKTLPVRRHEIARHALARVPATNVVEPSPR